MEDETTQAYNRRMRRFNWMVIAAALITLAIFIVVSWPVRAIRSSGFPKSSFPCLQALLHSRLNNRSIR
jgi:hypothetical protein